MSDLFQEVDQVMRQERLAKLWTDNKTLIIGFIVGTILLTAIISGYTSWTHNAQEKQTSAMIALLEDENFPDAITPEIKNVKGTMKAMTLIQAAAAHLENGNKEAAKDLYTYVANETGRNDYADLSLLMLTRLDHETSPVEALKPMTKNKKSPWRAQALLELAMYEAGVQNNNARAREYLQDILNSENVAHAIRQTAANLDSLYSTESDKE